MALLVPTPTRPALLRATALLCLTLGTTGPARAGVADREALKQAFDGLLTQPPLAGAHCSVQVQSLEDGQVLYSRSQDDALNPASNTKLVTSAAVLVKLGPEFRFTTDLLADRPAEHGRIQQLFVKGRGDPTLTTERLEGIVTDLWHRGVRSVGDLVLDDTYFDHEIWGPGWEQEGSDKSYAAPIGALSVDHNSVTLYVSPGDRVGGRARVELEPDTREYFSLRNQVTTLASNGRRKLRPHTFPDGEHTRVTVEGRIPLRSETVVLTRRITEPTFFFGQTFKMLLKQRGIRVTGKIVRGTVPGTATLVASYDSHELADIVRDMNKVSSNFMAEMLLKTLGAEVKGGPGTWAKGVDAAQDLLAELGLARGSYQLRNGSGLNDTNRFSAHQMTTLLGAMWKRFPVASEFVSSLGIAARDGTLRLRMEGTDAVGRLRAKTGTLDHVTALSGYVSSLGGERFAFSILVNDWAGRSTPVLASIDRLGGLLASLGSPAARAEVAQTALLGNEPVEARPEELRTRFAAYVALGLSKDRKHLTDLRSAVRAERDPVLRVAAADALFQVDQDQGAGRLLEVLPSSPELMSRLHGVSRDLHLPMPGISSLLDLAVDGNGEAVGRLLAAAPLARGTQGDGALATQLSAGLVEVGQASPDELAGALRAAPPAQALAGLELIGEGLARAGVAPGKTALAASLRSVAARPGAQPAQAAQVEGWLAVLERRPLPSEAPRATPAALPASVPGNPARPAGGPSGSTLLAPAGPGLVPAAASVSADNAAKVSNPARAGAPVAAAVGDALRAAPAGNPLKPAATGGGNVVPASSSLPASVPGSRAR